MVENVGGVIVKCRFFEIKKGCKLGDMCWFVYVKEFFDVLMNVLDEGC